MLLLLLLPAATLAQTPILVSSFEAGQPEHASVAKRLPTMVDRQLQGLDQLEVMLPSDVPYIKGQKGQEFMAACPQEQILGCTFDLAEVAMARWAVTGIVRYEPVFDEDIQPGVEVELTVLDIEEQEEAWSLVLPHSEGTEAEMVGWIERAVTALAAGDEPPMPVEEVDDELLDEDFFEDPEQDLSGLEREMGEVDHPEGVEDLGEGRQEREPLTMVQLLEEYGEEEPWLDMDLTPQQYLRWWNSGWGYRTWADKLQGRKGMFTMRGFAGYGAGPRGGAYNGQYAMDDVNWRTVLEYYAWQASIAGSGMSLGFELGYGVTPTLSLELGLGTHWGPYDTYVAKEYLGDASPTTVVDETGLQGVFEASLGARLVPMPFSPIRPHLGGGVVLWQGTKGDAHAELPPPPVELPIPSGNTLLGAYALVGGELALTETVGIVLQAPLSAFFAGSSLNVYDDEVGYIESKLEPPEAPTFGWGIEAGVQIHLGG
jgi:hypothetical protein